MKRSKVWTVIIPIVLVVVLLAVPAYVILSRMGFFTPAPTAEVTMHAPENAPELVFVADYDFDPYSYLNEDGTPNGLDVELSYELANRLGMRPRIEFGTWSECKTKIKEGEADVLLGLEIFVDGAGTGTLKSIPVGTDTLSIIGFDAIDDAAALSGKRVGVSFGSALMGLFRLNCEYVEYFTYSEMLEALDRGELDYAICHASVATQLIDKNSYGFRPSLVLMESFPTMGIRQDEPELQEKINQTLEEMSADGTISALREKWIVTNIQNRTVRDVIRNNQAFFILYAILAVVLLAGYIVALVSYRAALDRKLSLELVQEQELQLEESLTFTNYFLGTYLSAYYLNLETGAYNVYKAPESEFAKRFLTQPDYRKALSAFFGEAVHPEDVDEMLPFIQPENLKEIVKRGEFTHIFREISQGTERFIRMNIIQGADDMHAAIGFKDVTEEYQARLSQMEKDAVSQALSENYTRILALEDDFEVLYDVDLETGRYDIFVKGQTFGDVNNHLINNNSFFDDVEKNLEVVYPEDRQGNYDVTRPEFIRDALSREDHIDRFYRLLVDGKPAWARMRTVYKDAEKKNIIIGVFNAENDVEAKQIARQNEQLKKDMQLIGGLASGYSALYYINIDENIQDIYELDETKYPGSRAVFEGEPDLFKSIKSYGLSEHIHPDDQHLFEDFSAGWIREKLTDRKKYSMRFRVGTESGYRWDEMELTKYEAAGERANAVAVGFTDRDSDIRREQEYQRQLESAREAADAANQSKSNFLFSMSHDIRTPMNAIRGFTTMAKKNVGDQAKVTEYLDKIDISGQQLLTLINQVLEMARIESGKLEIQKNPINVREEFNSMVTVLSEQAKANGLRFIHSLGNLEHNDILADEARMSSVTLNITGNAMKYTPEGGTVEFGLEEIEGRKPGYATFVFTVADTGIGMSEAYIKELYEPFSREKNSTVSRIQGTGLGLSIVKKTLDMLGGRIDVQSELGKGTRFAITVDLEINGNAAVKAVETDSSETVSFRGRRLLLVEDNEMNREIARDILEEQGLIVEDADDGDVAVEMVRNADAGYYDFILMDVQMPRMNGYEATKAIRALSPETAHIPIIAMTANAFEEDRKNALAAGMDDHLAKPMDVQKVFQTIAKFLK